MRRHAIATLVLTAAVACSRVSSPPDSDANAPGTPDRSVRPIENYRNGLDDGARREFYHLSEGGDVIPLSILQALERSRTPQDPAGDGLLPFARGLQRYGFIPDETSAQNPFGLPVGMTVARSKLTDRLMVGFNCTTCHVGEVWRNGRCVRIDGGPNMIRLNDLFADVKTELSATLTDTGRRERFLVAVARQVRDNDTKMPSTRSLAQRAQ